MARVRVGLIGAGFITEAHAASLAQVPEAEIVAITSRRGERARELAARFAIPHVEPDWESLLARKDLDVVTVAVPNDLHAPITIAAAQQGKHVIVEKPLCRTLEEADAMIAACKEAGVKLMYGETLVFTPKYERARQLVDEGALGEVYLLKQLEKHSGPHFVDCVAHDRTPRETGEDGRAVLELIYAAYESAHSGRAVDLPFHRSVRKPIDLWKPPAGA